MGRIGRRKRRIEVLPTRAPDPAPREEPAPREPERQPTPAPEQPVPA